MLRKKQSMQEHLERMKYVSKYIINETPKYKSLVGNSGMDVLPEYLMKEAGKPEDQATPPVDPNAAPAPDANAAPTPDANAPAGNTDPSGLPPLPDASGGGNAPTADGSPAPAPAPAAPTPPASNTNVDISTAPSTQPDTMGGDIGVAPVESPEKRAMQLQLDALHKMSSTIEDLGASIDNLNQRVSIYSSEVDKVREPSDMEKFENRKIDSSPYYYNLNDLWDNNNFKARMDQFSKGYVKTEDGYVADFDDLPKLSPHEVKASFDI